MRGNEICSIRKDIIIVSDHYESFMEKEKILFNFYRNLFQPSHNEEQSKISEKLITIMRTKK